MPFPLSLNTAYRCARMLLFVTLLVTCCAAAAADCGQSETATLSDAARAILELNASLSGGASSGGVTAKIAGVRTSGSRAESTVLRSRAELLRALMQTHPDEVRQVMLPAGTAARLISADPANAAYVEHEATMSGELRTIAVDDFGRGAAQEVVVMHDPATANQTALHPGTSVHLQGLLRRSVSVSGVMLGSDLMAETVTPARNASARNGGENAIRLRAAAVPASNTTLTCSTTGQQRTAVLLLQFPGNTPAFPAGYGTAAWWQQAIAGQGKSVNALWSEMTAGATYASVDVYGPLTLPQSYGCADYLAMRSAALTLASNTIDLSKYTRIVLGYPASSCSFGGLADIGCNGADTIVPHPYSVVWMPIVTTYTASTGVWASLAHELGHNLGLNHANTLDFGTISLGPIDFQESNPGAVLGGSATASPTGAVTAVDTEYGDVFSAMGNPWSAGPGPYSAEHRAKLLGWIPASGTGNGLGTITAAGAYTIQPASGGTGLRALRVLRDAASASWVWLEYRNGGTPFDAANLAAVAGQNVSQGVVVHYENGYGDHAKTFELDMTPTGRGNNFADGALVAGSTWSDPYSPLSLKVNSITSAGLNVSVNYDSTCATFSVGPSPVSAAGGSGTVAVIAPATCTWQASSNASWMTLSGATRGAGNGSFTWSAAANTGSGQRVTYVTVGRVSQRLLQVGSGANVVALSPANATVAPGSSVTLSLALQDVGGLADLQTVELDAMGPGAAPCTVLADLSSGLPYFFLLDPTTEEYTAGVAAGSGSVSTAGCTLQGSGSGVSVSGGTISLALNLTFPASAPGTRALYVTVNAGTELPVGLLNVGSVTAPQTNPPTNTGLKATSTTLGGVPASAAPGATLALSAAVVAASRAGTPTGTVSFVDGSTTLRTVTLDGNGKAGLSVPGLAAGTHVLTALYSGDSSFAASTSTTATVTMGQAAPTTTTLTSSATQITAGGSAVLTVTVGHAGGAAVPMGTVALRDGMTLVSTTALSNATASIPLNALAAGTHALTATYSGDANYAGSTSSALLLTAGKFSATITVAAPATVLAGAAVRITVSANGSAASGSTVPTGMVLVQDNGAALGSVALANGTGVLALGSLPSGTHAITATYSGDDSFAAAGTGASNVSVVDFAITGPGTQGGISVAAGAVTGNTAVVTLTPGSNGFPLSIALVCSGAPSGATCTVSPAAVTPGSTAMPVTVTVSTTAASSKLKMAAGVLGLPLMGLAAFVRRRRHAWPLLTFAVAALSSTVMLTGCGTGVSGAASTATTSTPTSGTPGTSGTPAGTSTLTVQAVATSGGSTLAHSATVLLQVH